MKNVGFFRFVKHENSSSTFNFRNPDCLEQTTLKTSKFRREVKPSNSSGPLGLFLSWLPGRSPEAEQVEVAPDEGRVGFDVQIG